MDETTKDVESEDSHDKDDDVGQQEEKTGQLVESEQDHEPEVHDSELDEDGLDEDGLDEDGLLGGLDVEDSTEISVPENLIDQVIGQEHARDVISKAASQHRHVMMIGSPGTGKSMLAKAMTEIMPQERLQDVLMYGNPKDENEPQVRTVPAGRGQQIVDAHKEEAEKEDTIKNVLMWLVILVAAGYGVFTGQILFGIIAAGIVFLAFRYGTSDSSANIPNLLIDNSDRTEAPFEDATGAHAGALLGDVRHDPFQSGGMATPAHNRVESGSIHEASRGVLFVDEINTLDVRQQQKLMTAIQEGEFQITGQSDRSSGAMVQTEPVPTDFIMVAAGNMDAIENMHPALRDRIRGYGYEVYFDDTIDDTPEKRRKFARFVAQEVDRDGDIPHFTREAMEEVVLEARRRAGQKGKLTLQLRNLGGLVRTAGDMAREEAAEFTTKQHVLEAKDRSTSIEQQYVDGRIEQRKQYDLNFSRGEEVGRVNGLAVMGEDSGIVLPVMSKVSPSQGKGSVIATGMLQEIAQEAVENVSAIIKDIGGNDLNGKDVHIQFVQTHEGVDGDSASVTVATAVMSALENIPIRQDVAMTGSLSVRGDVLPVGGVTHKIEAAAKAGIETVIIPKANEQDVMLEDEYKEQIDVVPVDHIGQVLDVALAEEAQNKQKLLQSLRELVDATKLPGSGSPAVSD